MLSNEERDLLDSADRGDLYEMAAKHLEQKKKICSNCKFWTEPVFMSYGTCKKVGFEMGYVEAYDSATVDEAQEMSVPEHFGCNHFKQRGN